MRLTLGQALIEAWGRTGPQREKIHAIYGVVYFDGDQRDRGAGRSAPLRINAASGGDWSRLEEAWERGAFGDEIERLFVEDVIHADLASNDPERTAFPGDHYKVELEP